MSDAHVDLSCALARPMAVSQALTVSCAHIAMRAYGLARPCEHTAWHDGRLVLSCHGKRSAKSWRPLSLLNRAEVDTEPWDVIIQNLFSPKGSSPLNRPIERPPPPNGVSSPRAAPPYTWNVQSEILRTAWYHVS